MTFRTALAATVALTLTRPCLADGPPEPSAVAGSYTTTWLGNSIADGLAHVPQRIDGLFVGADGTAWTNADWDEGGGEVSRFDGDGRLTGTAGHTHGWGYGGGRAVTANGRYLYLAGRVDSEGGHLVDPATWPAKGRVWYGVSRRPLADVRAAAPFDGGKGVRGEVLGRCFAVVAEGDDTHPNFGDRAGDATPAAGVTAMAASATRLYVADAGGGSVHVYDAETMAPAGEWAGMPGVAAMAVDRAGRVWVARAGSIAVLNADGKAARSAFLLPAGVRPVGLAVDGDGRAVVADGGPAARILILDPDRPGAVPETIGGNLFAGVGADVGRVGPGRFADLAGVGVDAAGSVYVASGRTGAVLEKYARGPAREWRRHWVRYGLTFVDNCSMDPLTGDFYGSDEHFGFDWATTTPGAEWSFVGKTYNPARYPDDVRSKRECQPLMRRLNGGRLYAFATDQVASGLYVYRFDPATTGEVAVPSACLTKGAIGKPNTPARGPFLWHDADGDGRFAAGEVTRPPGNRPNLGDGCWGWWADEAGDVWQTVNGDASVAGLRHFPLDRFDAHGNPVYSLETMRSEPAPAPFLTLPNRGLERVVYDRPGDRMYLGGYTAQTTNDGMWGTFRVLARYDHWRDGNRKPAWVLDLPWDVRAAGRASGVPIGFAVAGDYVFVVGVTTNARLHVYRAVDGTAAGDLVPNNGRFTAAQTGWVDVRPFGVQAARRPDGTYAVTVEEDGRAKTVLYRWTPPG